MLPLPFLAVVAFADASAHHLRCAVIYDTDVHARLFFVHVHGSYAPRFLKVQKFGEKSSCTLDIEG